MGHDANLQGLASVQDIKGTLYDIARERDLVGRESLKKIVSHCEVQ